MYYDFLQTHKQKIILIAKVLLVMLAIATTVTLVGRIGKVGLTVATVPRDASVTINGNQIGNGTQWIKEGTYAVVIKKDGFETQKQTVTVTGDKSDNIIAASLTPKSKEAKEWAAKNNSAYKDNERYGAKQARAAGEYFTKQNPITKKLPFTDPYYKIGYVVGDNQAITLTIITPSPRYRFYAVEKIREWGYDPTDFVITFEDYQNPLEAK